MEMGRAYDSLETDAGDTEKGAGHDPETVLTKRKNMDWEHFLKTKTPGSYQLKLHSLGRKTYSKRP